jgi:hypothetical protein
VQEAHTKQESASLRHNAAERFKNGLQAYNSKKRLSVRPNDTVNSKYGYMHLTVTVRLTEALTQTSTRLLVVHDQKYTGPENTVALS